MGLISYKLGQTSVILRVLIQDNTVTNGAGKTSLTSATSGLIISTIADNEEEPTTYSAGSSEIEAVGTLGTYAAPTSGKCRFSEVEGTYHPGVYEVQLANARYAVSNAKSLLVSIHHSTNTGFAPCHAVIPLTQFDPYDSVRAGLTALPNAAAGGTGGLLIMATQTTIYPTQQYANFQIAQGNSYSATAREILITFRAGAQWPTDLSLWTWTSVFKKSSNNGSAGTSPIVGTATVVTATGTSRQFRIGLTAAQTTSMAKGEYNYAIRGTLAGETLDAVLGIATVIDTPEAT